METKKYIYLVIDMKCFFASVECVERGLDPFSCNLVVTDATRGPGTICLAISPKMKQLGVKNRCRLYEIPKNIEYITAKPRMKKYINYAAEVYSIYLQYIDKKDIYVYSIDECFIDATDYLKIYNLTPFAFAQKLKKEIFNKLKLTCSIGIGTNMFLAKVALDILAKKTVSGISFLDENIYQQKLWQHKPITDFWQISHGTQARLEKIGVFTMQDITKIEEKNLYKIFGINAELLIDHAWGKESCLMEDVKSYKKKAKSISGSQILPKDYNFTNALIVLKEMIQEGCYELQKNQLVTNELTIMVQYSNRNSKPAVKHKKLKETTNLFSIISLYAEKIFKEIVELDKPIRKLGYGFGNLQQDIFEKYDLFTNYNIVKKEKEVTKSILSIKDKFGKNALIKGIDLNENATQMERNKLTGGHNSE